MGNSTETEDSEEEVDEDGYLVLKPSKAEVYVIPEEKKKQKTKGGKLGETEPGDEDIWSQEQQKTLETALSQFPKGTSERWTEYQARWKGKPRSSACSGLSSWLSRSRRRKLVQRIKKDTISWMCDCQCFKVFILKQ